MGASAQITRDPIRVETWRDEPALDAGNEELKKRGYRRSDLCVASHQRKRRNLGKDQEGEGDEDEEDDGEGNEDEDEETDSEGDEDKDDEVASAKSDALHCGSTPDFSKLTKR